VEPDRRAVPDASGGNNAERHLLIAGYWTDIDESIRGWLMPSDSRSILSLHYYTPSGFCIDGRPTTWGSATEVATLLAFAARSVMPPP